MVRRDVAGPVHHDYARGDWDVIGLSRRGGASSESVRHIAVDLLDEQDAIGKLGDLGDVTHIFYAAYQDRGSWAELVAPNMAMLANTLNAAEPAAKGLRHVSLMQGYEVYGAHLGPFKTPAREDDPPHLPPSSTSTSNSSSKRCNAASRGRGRRSARRWSAAPRSATR